MVALITHKATIRRQIEAAERRAIQRCPEYLSTNVHWQMVDKLVSTQVEITERMDGLSKIVVTEGKKDQDSILTQFLNQDGPNKKVTSCDSADDSSITDGDVSHVHK